MLKRIKHFFNQLGFNPAEREVYALMQSNKWKVRSTGRGYSSGGDKYRMSTWNTYEITFPDGPSVNVRVTDKFVTIDNGDDDTTIGVSMWFLHFIHNIWVADDKKWTKEYERQRMDEAVAHIKKTIT